MYSRKQFFIQGAKRCFGLVRTCSSVPSLFQEEYKKGSDRSDHESLFLEAMRLGIDPGTMDRNQLSQAVKLLKEKK